MSDAFLGEIRMFSGNYVPSNPGNWMACNGQILNVSGNEALFSLLGTTYGGDGNTTFALPDLRGRLAMHCGQGTGLTVRTIGQKLGTETVTLVSDQLPPHEHPLQATTATANLNSPAGAVLAASDAANPRYSAVPSDTTKIGTMAADAVQATGGSQAHNNMMPYLCVNFIICTNGLYPTQD